MRRAIDFMLLRVSVRARLTILYGAIFLLAGGTLIVIFYLLFQNNYPGSKYIADQLGTPGPRNNITHTFPSGTKVTFPDTKILQNLDAHRARALDSLTTLCLIALGVVALAAVGFGWLMAGSALRPVRRITETAQRVADRSLHERITLQGPNDEFKKLADTFDAMLERLDASFDGQRQFVANASHELRTPLATNRTLIEVAIASGDVPAELRPVIDMVIAANARSELIIDGLLALAQSESRAIRPLPVDISDIAADVVEQTAREAATARVAVDAAPDPAITMGDPVLLERLALNLVRNGIRHNHPGGWVTVATAMAADGEAELIVANTGPVVRPQQIGMLFEPFRRLDSSRVTDSQGIGLGLSIVRAVVRAHSGNLTATAREGGGLIIRVRLPSAPDDDRTITKKTTRIGGREYPYPPPITHMQMGRRIVNGTQPPPYYNNAPKLLGETCSLPIFGVSCAVAFGRRSSYPSGWHWASAW